jgi:hypothetical protein
MQLKELFRLLFLEVPAYDPALELRSSKDLFPVAEAERLAVDGSSIELSSSISTSALVI